MMPPVCVGAWRIRDRGPRCGEALVHEPHGHRAFADRGRGSLGGPAADVADGEAYRAAGFQEQRHLAVVVELCFRDAAAGQQEPVAVLGELATQPLRAGLRSDEHEQAPDCQCRRVPLAISKLYPVELVRAEESSYLGLRPDGNARVTLDLVDQV